MVKEFSVVGANFKRFFSEPNSIDILIWFKKILETCLKMLLKEKVMSIMANYQFINLNSK